MQIHIDYSDRDIVQYFQDLGNSCEGKNHNDLVPVAI